MGSGIAKFGHFMPSLRLGKDNIWADTDCSCIRPSFSYAQIREPAGIDCRRVCGFCADE